MMQREIDGRMLTIPEHVAIILDGNGRWAKQRHMPRTYGHAQGSKNVEQICEDAWNLGIRYLTVYAFSTENWKRPPKEVEVLMNLFRDYLKNYLEKIARNNMRIRFIGDRTGLAEDIQELIRNMEISSKDNTGLNFTIALNYGSRDEIVRGVRRIAKEAADGTLDPESITESVIGAHLDTADLPDPDLMIRTSGEQRLSNYLLWQLAYTEFYFTDVFWPDFDRAELIRAIEYFNGRDRRYGGVK